MSVQCILEGQQDNTKFDKAGGTITGNVIIEDGNKICNSSQLASIQLNGDNTSGTISLTSENQNNASGSSMQLENNLAVLSATNYDLSAGEQTNAITLTGTQTTIKNVVTPIENGDAVNKWYVDQHAGGGVPTNHASTDTTYGVGDSNNYGHLKLSDSLEDLYSNEAGGVAATPNAVANLYNFLQGAESGKAPTYHASSAKTYGVGGSSVYGHVKLSDSHTSASGATSGVAATPSAVKAAYDLANGKAPKSHASTATTYGTGSSTDYGHVKLSASTSSTSGTSSGVAATPSAVKSAYDLANKAVTTLLGDKKIVCGWADVKFKNTSQQNTPVEFKTTFTTKPVVIIGQPFNSVTCTAFESNVTTTGFEVNVPAVGSATLQTRKMAWIAIGT